MNPSYDYGKQINEVLLKTADSMDEFDDEFEPQIRVADERFGDFQANGILPYAKKKGINPRSLAEKLIQNLPVYSDWKVSLAGPGFLNFKLSKSNLLSWLEHYGKKENLKTQESKTEKKKIVVDFSSPNTAKQMHVGHIRSTIIGECISRLLKVQGNQVTKDNHLGDWGTQFGILLYAIKREKVDLNDLGNEPIERLEDLYRLGNEWTTKDESAMRQAREELVKLQNGEENNLFIWKKICGLSMDAFKRIYELLEVNFDYSLGESFYRNKVQEVYDSLIKIGLCKEDQGALVVFHPEHKRFAKQPFIIRKSDGASNYATTDLAALLYRTIEWQADQIIYVTDGRQRDHFEQLFLTTEKWFHKKKHKLPTLTHVWFGTILGNDNKAIKTREGKPIRLIDLLDEAVNRAGTMVRVKNPNLNNEEVLRRAKIIGLGAVKYADLSQDRTLDYVFSWEKLLAMQGNTSPYLQYAVARIHSIFRKMNQVHFETGEKPRPPETVSECKLARKLTFFPMVMKQTRKELKPHYLCTYLFELATEFSSFYNQDKVIAEQPDAQALRILLCECTLGLLEIGLSILGIETLEEM